MKSGKRFLLVVLFLVMIGPAGAQPGRGGEDSPGDPPETRENDPGAQEAEVSEEDLEIIANLEFFEDLELYEEMELFDEFPLVLEGGEAR